MGNLAAIERGAVYGGRGVSFAGSPREVRSAAPFLCRRPAYGHRRDVVRNDGMTRTGDAHRGLQTGKARCSNRIVQAAGLDGADRRLRKPGATPAENRVRGQQGTRGNTELRECFRFERIDREQVHLRARRRRIAHAL